MKKIKNFNVDPDKILNRRELKTITGGTGNPCQTDADCQLNEVCIDGYCGIVGDRACEVTCNTGYYACCRRNILVTYCNCILNGQSAPNTCDAGGPGASQCQISF